MPSRRMIESAVQAPPQAAGSRTCPPPNCGDYAPSAEIASADCAARVSDVLSRLGYGFDVIPSGSSAPKRA